MTTSPAVLCHLDRGYAELRMYGVLGSSSTARKKVSKKVRTASQNSSGIHRALVLMPVCRRISSAPREGQTRREAGPQHLGASHLYGRGSRVAEQQRRGNKAPPSERGRMRPYVKHSRPRLVLHPSSELFCGRAGHRRRCSWTRRASTP
jgi:hypothetical protein